MGDQSSGGRTTAAHDARSDRPAAAPAPTVDQAPYSLPYLPARLFYIPGYWEFIAPAMISGAIPALVAAGRVPDVTIMLAILAAVLLGSCCRYFIKLERSHARRRWQRALVLLAGVGLPLLLYGLAAAGWARAQGSPFWIGGVGMAGLAGAAAALLLARRPPAMLVAQVAIWLPLVASGDSPIAWLIFGCGSIGGAVMVWRQTMAYQDAMEKRRLQQRVQRRAYDILVDYERSGQGWFWETDREGHVTYLSPSLSKAFGCPVEGLHGRPFAGLFAFDVTGNESAATVLNLHFAARTDFRDILVSVHVGAEDHWWSISGTPIVDRFGNYFGFRGFGWDQTEKRRSQERSSRLAHYDSLTGAANRMQMSQSLETILNAPDPAQRNCAVILIDLDRFKQVNDTLGHPAGDAVLRRTADRLRQVVGARGRIGRLGGDEFQVILPGRQDLDNLAMLAEQMLDSLSQPHDIDGQRAEIGASLGIAVAPRDGVTSEALIRNADLALYASKDAGRGCYRFYVPDLHSDAEERRQFERDLREAVASGGLELWYQPIIHTRTEQVSGFEALLRWNHPRLGHLSPARFVPIAEETGLIAQIGEWALRKACSDLANWPETVRVAVNLSPLQFANPLLPTIVSNALASAMVDPSRLELEITESVFLNEEGCTEAMFSALKRTGVRLALDDFGTGYSSISYFEAAPFDCIKLDQSFLRGANAPGSRFAAILASIVGLAEALGMETTAEGVETLDELELVRVLGCTHVQGYVYEAPMSLQGTLVRLASGLGAGIAERRTGDLRRAG